MDLALLERYDDPITDLELTIVGEAKRHDGDAFHRLRSVPGIGKVLALTILYEIHDITRFDRVQEFASYARLVKCAHQSLTCVRVGVGLFDRPSGRCSRRAAPMLCQDSTRSGTSC